MTEGKPAPRFVTNPTKVDLGLFGFVMAMSVYSLGLIPFRAYMLVNETFTWTLLTGSSISVLIQGAQNPDRPLFLAVVVLAAALSMVKFLPVFFIMGKRWGREYLDMSFAGHPPLWFRKMEGFIHRRMGVALFLAFLPFSPIPATVLVVIAGIQKFKGWVIWVTCFTLAVMLKCFYLYLGLRFGEEVQASVQLIDKYVMRISLVLLAYTFAMMWWRNRKQKIG